MDKVTTIMTLCGVIGMALGVLVIRSREIEGIIYLVVSIVNGGVMIIILGMNYIGLTIIIIYAVAISLLMIFIIMMLDLNTYKMNEKWIKKLIIISMYSIIIYNLEGKIIRKTIIMWESLINNNKMINTIGYVLYTTNITYIVMISIILLMVMIGVIKLLKD